MMHPGALAPGFFAEFALSSSETALDRAAISFEWRFEGIEAGRMRLTQRMVLSGGNAAARLEEVQAGFTLNLNEGMKRIAAAMARAESGHGQQAEGVTWT